MENIKFWQRTSFWNKIESSCALAGSITVGTMAVERVEYKWFLLAGAVGFVGKLLSIWVQDRDNNGVIDPL